MTGLTSLYGLTFRQISIDKANHRATYSFDFNGKNYSGKNKHFSDVIGDMAKVCEDYVALVNPGPFSSAGLQPYSIDQILSGQW